MAGQHFAQELRPPPLIVHVLDQGVLDTDASPGALGIEPGRIENLRDLPPIIDRHQGVSKMIIRCVQGDRQRDGQPLLGQLPNPRNEADGRHRDATSTHAQSLRGRVNKSVQCRDHGAVVCERLPHTHEHDVADATRATGNLVVRQRPRSGEYLLHDFRCRQVARETCLPRCAKRTVHAAAGLRRDTHRDPIRIAHQH